MNPQKPKILVVGATGYVGGRLVPLLIKEGYPVRCLARNPEKLKAREWKNIELYQGDVLEPDTLSNPLKDIDVAFYLVHSMGNQKDFEDLDAKAARNFGRAAKEAGINRIIYLGGLARETQNLSSHLKSRQEVGQILGESGVSVTELRASIIIGSGSASFEIIRDLTRKLPVMITPRWVKSLCEPISIRNVLEYLLGCLKEPRTRGEILEIGGGEILTYANMMKAVAEVLGKKLLIIPVPVLTPRLSAYWLNIVTTVPMSIAYALIDGLKNNSICTDHRIRELIPIKLFSFKESVHRALDREASGSVASSWTEASSANMGIPVTEGESKKILQDIRILEIKDNPKEVCQRIQKIGGDVGWYYANWAWKLRGIMDRMIGGVGMRRGRRHPEKIRIGDAIDFWRVEGYSPGSYLRLRAEMKLPGLAWLEFRVYQDKNEQNIFQQTATFLPSNWFGILYWYLVMPAHFFVFKNMARRIVNSTSPD